MYYICSYYSHMIESNLGNSFLKKSYTKLGGTTSSRLFFKKLKIDYISGLTVWNFIQFLILYVKISQKLFSVWRYLDFRPGIFGHLGERVDKKTEVNFKIYDNTSWETNNHNTHVIQEAKGSDQNLVSLE